MKGPAELTKDITRRLETHWARDTIAAAAGPENSEHSAGDVSSVAAWPHAFPLGNTSSADLAAGFGAFLTRLGELRTWAAEHHTTLHWQDRRVAGTEQRIPTHASIASMDDAAAIAADGWPDRLARARTRAHVLATRYPHAADPRTLTAVTRLSDLDFDLLTAAADWFATHTGAGLTSRQVPVEGLHAKWLNTRQQLVAALAGKDSLELLPPHPARIHFTYLDPAHRSAGRRIHDSATVGDVDALAYRPSVVVISENKDTAIHFPPIPGGVSIEGVGRGGGTLAAFSWVRDADGLIYWGDMDADGFEILDGFRAAGLPVRSVLMDQDAYATWNRYGTNVDPKGQPLKPRTPAPTPYLTGPERDLYLQLCDADFGGHRRVEQERIPLAVAAAAVVDAHRDAFQEPVPGFAGRWGDG